MVLTEVIFIIMSATCLVCALPANEINDVPKIITQAEWSTIQLFNNLTNLQLPVNRVILTHTATDGCETQAQCIDRVRFIQKFHTDYKKWDDIAYNFLIGGDGGVYEGRGWDKQGAHTKGYNAGSIGVAFIGTFTKQSPVQIQFDALKQLLAEGVRLDKLVDDFKLYPHRAFYETESPGDQVIKVIEHWPNYVGKL